MHIQALKFIAIVLTVLSATSVHALRLNSSYALVISNDTGEMVMEKKSDVAVPIASLTKLMTAMVVLDSNPSMDELISITAEDVDRLKHSKSYVRVGTTLTRRELLQLALMSSENRAANSLARTYVGGRSAFINAVNEKIKALGMTHTMIGEPTGLSPNNVSTASDLAKMAAAASRYPLIPSITSHSSAIIKAASNLKCNTLLV